MALPCDGEVGYGDEGNVDGSLGLNRRHQYAERTTKETD